MFNIFKREDFSIENNISVDIHSHIIPSIDDGSKSIEESIELIKKFISLGYKKLIITPHIDSEMYPNNPDIISKGLEELKVAVKENNLEIELVASAEYYLDEGLLDLISKNELIPIENKYILFETSYINKPSNLEDIIYEIKLLGYTPILAHPERYRYIEDLKDFYFNLKDLGVLFQININSTAGHYGKEAKSKVEFLINNGLVDFIGSDTHKMEHLNSIETILSKKKILNKIVSKNNLLNKELL